MQTLETVQVAAYPDRYFAETNVRWAREQAVPKEKDKNFEVVIFTCRQTVRNLQTRVCL